MRFPWTSKSFLMLVASGLFLLVALLLDGVIHWILLRTSRLPWLSAPTGMFFAVAGVLVLAPLAAGQPSRKADDNPPLTHLVAHPYFPFKAGVRYEPATGFHGHIQRRPEGRA
jgi:hypothetical protein